jgi:hypothetical protein
MNREKAMNTVASFGLLITLLSGCTTQSEAVTVAGDDSAATSGLPCDVDAVLRACRSCHSDPPTAAPMPLVTYAQLLAPAKSDPSKTVAQLAAERIQSTTNPMPPASRLSSADIAVVVNWVGAGAPSATCAPEPTTTATPDGGSNACVLNSDCPGSLVCHAGVCDVECATDKDCIATWTCRQTRCYPPDVSASGGGVVPDAGGAVPDAGGVVPDGGSPDAQASGEFGNAKSWSVADLRALTQDSYSGTTFDGRYVYFAPDGAGTKVLRNDTLGAFAGSSAWSVFDLATLDANAAGYRGAVFDGRYVYFVPFGKYGLVARYDSQGSFDSAGSWTIFDLNTITAGLVGFTGATFDGRHVYLIPAFNTGARAVQLDTQGVFTNASSWAVFSIATIAPGGQSFAGGVFDGRYVYYVPWSTSTGPAAILTRYDTQAPFADAASWSTLNLKTLNPSAGGYHTAAFDGRYLYLVPGWTAPNPVWSSTMLARFDTQMPFTSGAAWSFYDLAALGLEAGGFNAPAFDGRYLIFTPGYSNNMYGGLAFRHDTSKGLDDPASWSSFDLTALDPALVNLKGAAFDGHHIYMAPTKGAAARLDAVSPGPVAPPPAYHGSFY